MMAYINLIILRLILSSCSVKSVLAINAHFMLYKIIFISMCLLVATILNAQPVEKPKENKCSCSFTSINQVGFLAGEGDDSYQFQTVNGLQYKTWTAGAGIGIDGYRYRSIPVLLQLRKEFPVSGNAFFIYNDIGLNYPWVKDSQKSTYYGASNYSHGVYYDGGVGYRWRIKKQSLLFSSGFTLKKMKEDRSIG